MLASKHIRAMTGGQRRLKPRVVTHCIADHYAGPNERIVEFSDARGVGGLISFATSADGRLIVDPYRLDDLVYVRTPPRPGDDKVCERVAANVFGRLDCIAEHIRKGEDAFARVELLALLKFFPRGAS